MWHISGKLFQADIKWVEPYGSHDTQQDVGDSSNLGMFVLFPKTNYPEIIG